MLSGIAVENIGGQTMILRLRLQGKAKYVFAMIKLLAQTKPMTSLSYPVQQMNN